MPSLVQHSGLWNNPTVGWTRRKHNKRPFEQINALSCNYLVQSKLIFVLVLTAQASLSDLSWSQSDNPSNLSDDFSPCFTWNPLITLLTTDKSTSVFNCTCLNWRFHNEFCTIFPSGAELQADHPLHRVREDEGAGLAGQEGASGSANEGSHPAGKHFDF